MQVRSIAECSEGEHSAKLSTFIKLSFVIKIFVLSIFEWPLKTGFTVFRNVMFITAAVPRNCPVTFSCPSTCLTGYTSGSDGCPLCVCVGQQGKAFIAVTSNKYFMYK